MTPAEARQASTWIERIALPIAVSVMEAQPLGLIVAVMTFALTGKLTVSFMNIGGIALLTLVLLWWALWIEHLRLAHHMHTTRQTAAHLLGWFVALAVVVGPSLPSVLAGNALITLLNVGVVTWLWRRGISRARGNFEYAQITTSFKVALGVLLFLLVLALLLPHGRILLDAFADILPIFFLSGLTTLSLSRLGAIRNARSQRNDAQADPTRVWLLALTLLGGGVVAIVLVLESIFSFTTFEQVLSMFIPLWDVLGTLLGWLFYGFIIVVFTPLFTLITFLVGLLPHDHAAHSQQTLPTSPFSHLAQQGPQTIPPVVLTVGRWVFLALACLILLLVVRASLRRIRMLSFNESIEEGREGLDAGSLLNERWREWWNNIRRMGNTSTQMEALDPTSARARYRELLQHVALMRSELGCRPAETPDEYEARLRLSLERGEESLQDAQHDTLASSDAAILGELTHAYTRERYGGRETSADERVNLHVWMARLTVRLTGKIPRDRSSGRSSRMVLSKKRCT